MKENQVSMKDTYAEKALPRKKKKKVLKVILVVFCSLLCLLILIVGALWGIFNHYYNMLDYDQLFDEEDSFVSVEIEDEEDDIDPDSIDSSKLATDEEKDKFLEQLDKVDKLDKATDTEKPSETKKPTETEKPADTEKPSETKKPTETEKPAETKKPTDTEKPADTEKTTDTGTSVDTEKPTETETQTDTEAPTDTQEPDDAPSLDNNDQTGELRGGLGKIERKYDCEYISRSDDVINILLIGTDSRLNANSGKSDVMMLVSICPSQKKIVLTSFLRDTYVMIPRVGKGKLNLAYAYGGPSLLVETVEKNFGVRIDRYVMTNFFTFVDVVNSIGTVRVYINDAELSVLNEHIYWTNSILDPRDPEKRTRNMIDPAGAGYYELNGVQALAFARIRNIDSDFGRTSRQRVVMSTIFDSVAGMSVKEWNSLLELILPKIKTNLTQGDILKIMLSLGTYMKYDIGTASMPPDDHFKHMIIDGYWVLGVDLDYIRGYLASLIYAK